jgi:methyltransferase (TIGR00027 family)
MARTHDDDWDLASSVGATATMVAAGRAMATKDPRGLIDDPFAEPLVRAVGIDFFTQMVDGKVDAGAFEGDSAARMKAMVDGMAMRTKFFDDYFIEATAAGVRQAVILAAGLDSRAYRLPWPAGTVVYEVDQPRVIEFKTTTLAGIGAQPTATRRTVAVDLRGDWPAALRAAGLDTGAPIAWLAEGLLIYLPPEAQDRLFADITALSVPGSTIATEFAPGIIDFDAERARERSATFRERGVDIDMASLVYAGPRNNGLHYLRDTGWDAQGTTRTELLIRHGLDVSDTDDSDLLGEILYISGRRVG